MNPVKQALIAFKTNWKESLYLGAAATVFTFFSQTIPVIGALLVSFGLLIFQELVNVRMKSGSWKMDLSHFKNDWVSLLIVAIILMPTGILLGSAFGLIESPQSKMQSLPMSLGLFILGIYFFLILVHGFNLHQQTREGVAKALDVSALASIRNFKTYLAASFYVSLALMVGSLLRGAGFVVALPFMFYVSHFVFAEMASKNAFVRKGS